MILRPQISFILLSAEKMRETVWETENPLNLDQMVIVCELICAHAHA